MSSDAVYARVEESLAQLSLRAEELRVKANHPKVGTVEALELRAEALGILTAIRVVNKTVFTGEPEPRDAQRMGE